MKHLIGHLPFALVVLFATVLTVKSHATGNGVVISALFGSIVAFSTVWLTCFSIYRLIVFVTRGAPFKVGDVVRITAGDDAGKMGEVSKLVEGRDAVFLTLEGDEGHRDSKYFDWNKVTRRGVSKDGWKKRNATIA